jgi:hypothetical protein
MAAGDDYMGRALESETVVTLGAAVDGWRKGAIDASVSVGPLECLPNKLAESQFFHVSEREGLPALSLSLNGEPIDPERLDAFAWEVKERFARRRSAGRRSAPRATGRAEAPSFATSSAAGSWPRTA